MKFTFFLIAIVTALTIYTFIQIAYGSASALPFNTKEETTAEPGVKGLDE